MARDTHDVLSAIAAVSILLLLASVVWTGALMVERADLQAKLTKTQADVRYFKGRTYFLSERYEESLKAERDDFSMALYSLSTELDKCKGQR